MTRAHEEWTFRERIAGANTTALRAEVNRLRSERDELKAERDAKEDQIRDLQTTVCELEHRLDALLANERRTSDMLQNIWPTPGILRLAQQAEQAGCLSDEDREWLNGVGGE